jgi:hypothetical protein
MSVIKVNNITNRDGTSGPVIAGIATVSSTSHMVVPIGRTGQRYADDGENIVRNGLVLYLDAKYSYPGLDGVNTDIYNWYDLSGNENNGELKNGVSYSTTDGGSLVFDGSNDFIQMSYPPSFFSNYTLSCWFRASSFGTNAQGLVAYGNESNYQRRTIFLWDGGSGNVRVTSSAYTSNILASTTLSLNTWYYAAITLSSTAEAKIYLNGVLDGSGTHILESPSSNTLYIGRTGSGEYFNGRIPVAHIYNRVLSAAEILQNYNALKSRFGL